MAQDEDYVRLLIKISRDLMMTPNDQLKLQKYAGEDVTAAEATGVANALVDKARAPKARRKMKKKKKKKVGKQSTTTFAYPTTLSAATTPPTITTGLNDIGDEGTVALVLDGNANCTSANDLDYPPMEEKDDEITEKVGYNRFMLGDVWSIGWEKLERDNVRKTQQLAAKQEEKNGDPRYCSS